MWCWYLGRMTKTPCLFSCTSGLGILLIVLLNDCRDLGRQLAEALIAYVAGNWVSVGLLLSQFIFYLGMPFCFVWVPCSVLVAGCFFELGVYLLLGNLLSAMLQFVWAVIRALLFFTFIVNYFALIPQSPGAVFLYFLAPFRILLVFGFGVYQYV